MDSKDFNRETYNYLPVYLDVRETKPTFLKFLASRRRGTIASTGSPRVNGKLVLRQNPFSMVVRTLMSHVSGVPEYYPFTNKIRLYSSVPAADDNHLFDSDLVTQVNNRVHKEFMEMVREKKINVSQHLAEFMKHISYFEKRLGDLATIVRVIISKKERVLQMKKLLSRDSRYLAKIKEMFRKYGTLPKELKSHPDYYPRKNRHKILMSLQKDLHYRDKTVHKEMADLTLEYSYAVSPIAQDCKKLADKIDNFDLNNLPLKIRSGGNSKLSDVMGRKPTMSNRTTDNRVNVSISGYLTLVDSRLNTLEQFGFSNLPALVWELTWLSFAVDWVYPIGTWLAQFSALNGWKLSNVATTTTVRCTTSIVNDKGAYSSGSYKSITRVIGSYPDYTLKFQNPFTSFRRGANQLALVTSFASRR